jgi:NAD(P)-dependent dehydrogenase (short-subunit alcohol dehydrogenase family)
MIFRSDVLDGKRILVTGASSGIGRAAAIQFAKCGASIILSGRDVDRLDQTKQLLPGDGHVVAAADCALLDEAYEMMIAQTKSAGPVSAVFHAAGIASLRIAKLYNQQHIDSVFGAAVNGALGIAKACGRKNVLADGGSLIFMSSVAGYRGRPGMGSYAASKAAIGGLTRALAAEFAVRGVRVNEIVAGAVETPMHDSIVKNLDESAHAVYRDLHLLGFGKDDDIANIALFLVSDASRWITGSSVVVDGGYMAG